MLKTIWKMIIPNFIKNFIKIFYLKKLFFNSLIDYSTINNLCLPHIIKYFYLWKNSCLGKDITIFWKFYIWDYSYIWDWWKINWNDKFWTKIWKYCAIAHNLYIISVNNHYYNLLTINDKLLKKIWKKTKITGGNVEIWNDVWIWANVTILYWVNIWNWSIIWAWSLVNRDIPAYSIAVWNPARVIKYRFSKEQISYLENSKWWNLSEDKISVIYKNFNKKYSIKDSLFLEK